MKTLTLTINAQDVAVQCEDRTHLADFVRECAGYTGTHIGCEQGVCGACTILLDGEPVRSCLMFAASAEGHDVTTIEGLENDPIMVALRQAFRQSHALQCGYCTPGMLITARDIIKRFPSASEAEIRRELSGNLCRCTGYQGIVQAIKIVLDSTNLPQRSPR